MRSVLLAVAAMGAGVAPAAASPGRCPVTVSEAPDDVRAAIERALAAETACGPALVVRVVAARDGLLVEARDDRDRLRSRVVADAQTAADLIASWAADDRVRPREPRAAASPAEPGARTAVSARVDASAPHERWAMVAASIGAQQGARAEVDLLGERFTLGLAVEGRTGTVRAFAVESEAGAVAYLAVAQAWQRWRVRASLAAGVEYAALRMENDLGDVWARGTAWKLVTEASVTVSRSLDADWSITAGLAVAVLPDPSMSAAQMTVREDLPAVAPRLLLGVSRGL